MGAGLLWVRLAASSALRWVKSDQAAGVAASASVAAGWLLIAARTRREAAGQ